MDAFASRTGTKRNLAALRAAGWGLFVAAAGVHRHEGFRFWAENSAYTWWQRGLPFQVEPWQRLLDSHGRDPLCEGIVAPDIVCKAAGVDSFDGSGPSRFAVVTAEMERFRAEMVQLGLALRVSAWVFFALDGASLWVELDVPEAGGLDVLLLVAWDHGARDIHEIQVEGRDGAYEARGAGFVFVSWAELDARG